MTDFSVNNPAPPNIGAAFGTSGPYANYVWLQTVPADAQRSGVEVMNVSGAQIVLVLDDGTQAVGMPPDSVTLIPLAGGAAAGSQGGSWASDSFKGRVQIYAPSSAAQVAVRADSQ